MPVTVSPPTAADLERFVAAVRASRSLHHPWVDPPDDPTRFGAYLARSASPGHAAFLVRHDDCGGLVGFVNVNNIVRGALRSGQLGYAGFLSHAGRGLMTEGLRQVLAIVFGELDLHRVEANVQPRNVRSLALVRRLGFRREGYSPGYLFVDGHWRDHERWALRSENWTAGRDDQGDGRAESGGTGTGAAGPT